MRNALVAETYYGAAKPVNVRYWRMMAKTFRSGNGGGLGYNLARCGNAREQAASLTGSFMKR